MYMLKFLLLFSEGDPEDMKNPMAAAGAVKDALAGGNVDKVHHVFDTKELNPSPTEAIFHTSKDPLKSQFVALI